MSCTNPSAHMKANKAHALDGGIASLFRIGRQCPAASDAQRSAVREYQRT